MQHHEPLAAGSDLGDAHARWGRPLEGPLVRWSDAWKMPARLPFAFRLGRAALADPRAFWIMAIARRRHRALQKPLELFAYLRYLRPRRIVHSLEIGSLWGGMVYAHCAVSEPDGHAIAIDAFPRETSSWMTSRFERLAGNRQQVTCIWRDSHSEEALALVRAALNDAPLDLLFIDGDHSLDGVTRDYEMYSPLVRHGGLVAFHDIASAAPHGVPALWRQLAERHESVEFVDSLHPPIGLGIGVIIQS